MELKAAASLLHDAEKSSKAEMALQLLHAVIAGEAGAYIGLTLADATGLKVGHNLKAAHATKDFAFYALLYTAVISIDAAARCGM